jgi:hypothetical protein
VPDGVDEGGHDEGALDGEAEDAGDAEDAELAAYNAYLAQLAARDRASGR